MQPHIRDSLTQEALTTSAIEGEKLDPESVRSCVARRLGLDTSRAPVHEGRRNIEGLIDVLQDATLNTDAPLTLERLCSWHGALFPVEKSQRASRRCDRLSGRHERARMPLFVDLLVDVKGLGGATAARIR